MLVAAQIYLILDLIYTYYVIFIPLSGDSKFKSTMLMGIVKHGWKQNFMYQTQETNFLA